MTFPFPGDKNAFCRSLFSHRSEQIIMSLGLRTAVPALGTATFAASPPCNLQLSRLYLHDESHEQARKADLRVDSITLHQKDDLLVGGDIPLVLVCGKPLSQLELEGKKAQEDLLARRPDATEEELSDVLSEIDRGGVPLDSILHHNEMIHVLVRNPSRTAVTVSLMLYGWSVA